MTACKSFSPQLMAHGKERFERGDPVMEIAAEFDVHDRTIYKMAQREGWKRPARQLDLASAMRLHEQAKALAARMAPAAPAPAPFAEAVTPAAENPELLLAPPVEAGSAPGETLSAAAPTAAAVPDPVAIERIERAVLNELAAVESMRAQLGVEPQKPLEAQQTARTLATLTHTLQTLQRMRCGQPPASGWSDHDDDMPRDIDEFRREYARRIRAFVEARIGGGACGTSRPAGDVAG